ncbi:MAG: serine hydrolase, partial [Candidatus Heimdallarchaeota archaeon]
MILVNSFLIQNNVSLVVSRSYWPTEEWQTTQPEQQNMQSEILNPVVDYIEEWNEDHQFSDVDSIIVVKNGFIVKEAYFGLYGENDIHVLWSVTKSITSILIGIAIKEGYIESVEENVLEYFSDREIANVDERKESIKLKHLLMMSTGFDYPGDNAIWPSWM